ncbi:MAG TPA: MauE/DoxX family redox-associated membrane protein [Candidatus Eremiobacteraceae bacterium]|jgi:uncharacterized membrane protein YphA (DoxX/SURF4 family)
MNHSVGRYLYGVAVIGFAICALVSNDANNWQQEVAALGNIPHREILSYIVAAVEILGGLAVLLPRTARAGAAALAAIWFIFALLGVPFIFRHPLVYNEWGNFFEQFSFVSGALILYASSDPNRARASRWAQIGYYSFGLCVVSFGLEQLFYLANTASLVPKWLPPGQMFWAIATTVAFELAAVALLTGLMARLASRLNTAMLVGFGLLVWLPLLITAPHALANWTESIDTLGIIGSAWIVAEYLGRSRSKAAVEV